MQNILLTYFNKISKFPLLTQKEESELIIKAQAGDKKAFDKFITSNLRLVISIALKFQSHLEILDAINQGNIGLIQALYAFDCSKHLKFSTYATWWIKKSILSYIYFHNDLIKQSSSFHKIQKHLRNYYHEEKLYPSIEELSALVHLDPKTIIASLENYTKISLDADIDDNDSYVFHEIIAAPIEQKLFDIDFLLSRSRLNEKEKKVIMFVYGFDEGGYNRPLKDVGILLNLCTERVRQIRNNALIKIKRTILRYKNELF
jgi:RNA polymerase primary sigma factor